MVCQGIEFTVRSSVATTVSDGCLLRLAAQILGFAGEVTLVCVS